MIFAVALLFAGIASTITSGMAAGSIFAGIYREPYDIKDSHSRWGVLLSLVMALIIIMLVSNYGTHLFPNDPEYSVARYDFPAGISDFFRESHG